MQSEQAGECAVQDIAQFAKDNQGDSQVPDQLVTGPGFLADAKECRGIRLQSTESRGEYRQAQAVLPPGAEFAAFNCLSKVYSGNASISRFYPSASLFLSEGEADRDAESPR